MRAVTNIVLVISIWIAAISLTIFGMARACAAQSALALVRCIRAECETCNRDPREQAAIAWILLKGAQLKGVSLYRQTVEYCALFNRHNDRAREITESTFDNPKRGSIRWWERAHVWVIMFLSGRIPDPEPSALHWGGSSDTRRMKGRILLRSFCDSDGQRCNHLWGVKIWRI